MFLTKNTDFRNFPNESAFLTQKYQNFDYHIKIVLQLKQPVRGDELDRLGNCDNFNIMGVGGSIVSASLQEALAGNAKRRWNVYTMLILLYIYSKILGVRLPVCHVIKNKILMLIKV